MKVLAIVLVALASSTMLVPHAAAAVPGADCPGGLCKMLACTQAENWSCAQSNCPVASNTKVPNCGEYACATAGGALPAPYTARSCQDTLCRSIPALYGTITTPVAGVASALGGLIAGTPAGSIVTHVLLRMAVVCEPGMGGGSGSGCQRVLYTPVLTAGANVIIIPSPTTGTVKAQECSWVATSLAGPMTVSDGDSFFASTGGSCANTLVVRPTFGPSAATWVFTNGC